MANLNTAMSVPVAGITSAANTTAAVPALLASGSAAVLTIPGSWNMDGHPFRVRLTGKYTVGATSATFKPQIFVGSSTVTTSNSNFVTNITAVSTNLASILGANFIVEAECLWDSTTTSLNGSFDSEIYNVFAAAATTTQVTGLTALGNAGTTGLNFVPFFTFSAASTLNSVTVTEFSIEQV